MYDKDHSHMTKRSQPFILNILQILGQSNSSLYFRVIVLTVSSLLIDMVKPLTDPDSSLYSIERRDDQDCDTEPTLKAQIGLVELVIANKFPTFNNRWFPVNFHCYLS